MNEDALRALVRETIARIDARAPLREPGSATAAHPANHPSGYKYALTPSDGPCLIEPGVPCNHCGYCLSHGH